MENRSFIRVLNRQDILDLAYGAAFLGSGGGGDPYNTLLEVLALHDAGQRVELLDVAGLSDDAIVTPCGWIGAPTVCDEKLPSGDEAIEGLRRMEVLLGKQVDAVLPIEIGGSNGLAPLVLGARAGVPVLDCDGMGRAFPESQMVVFHIAGIRSSPAVLTADNGSCVVIEASNNLAEEVVARAVAISLGASCHMIDYPMSGRQLKDSAVIGSVSVAIGAGRAVRESRALGQDPFPALFQFLSSTGRYQYAGAIFEGKIVDLDRKTVDGFSVGTLRIASFNAEDEVEITFQNENLFAQRNGRPLAMVPDIITIMDAETAVTITTERLRFGQRVRVVASSVPDVLRTARALAVLGPSAFGIDVDYERVEVLNGWKRTPDGWA